MDNRLKAATDGALKKLITALESGQSDTLKAYLKSMGHFHNYSWSNTLLIYWQKPNATHVAGFKAWLKLNRHVKKGEHGILIVVPMFLKSRNPAKQDETVLGFTSGHVFDISQTDGEPLPSISSVKGDPKCHVLSLRDHIMALGIELIYSDLKDAHGLSAGGRITIHHKLEPAEEFATLCHELAHELMHKSERRKDLTKTQRELEAEAVAFVCCSAIGLETNNASSDYIQLYQGSADLLMASLSFIQQASSQILEAIV